MKVRSLGWEDSLEEGIIPTPVFFPGESHGQRSLVSYTVHRVTKSQKRLKRLDMNPHRMVCITFFIFFMNLSLVLLEEVAINPTREPPELTQDCRNKLLEGTNKKPCVHQDPGERSSDPTRD